MMLEMIGRIDECFLLSYAIDPKRAAALVPAGLELITNRGSAFLNIVVCHVERMRPRVSPPILGVTYWHIAYRLQVRAITREGVPIEGLYFLRSDVDRPFFGALGNCLTDFRFNPVEMRFRQERECWRLSVNDSRGLGSATLCLHFTMTDDLVSGSPFSSIEERERVLKYAPLGLSTSRSGHHLRVAEVIRDEALWKEEPVRVETAAWSFVRSLGFTDPHLVRATRVFPIDYRWRIGRIVPMRSPSVVNFQDR